MVELDEHAPLRLCLDGKAETYWIQREPPGPDPASMIHQF